MAGSIFGFPLRPTSGQGVIWGETLGGRMDVGALAQTASGLTGLTLNRVPFGNSLGGLQDSANLTFDGTTLTLTGVSVAGVLSLTNTTEASAVGTAAETLLGGLGVAKRSFLGTIGASFKGNVLAGVQDGTAAVSGQVGEEIESNISTAQNAAGTGTYLALTSITLTPGDWDISALVEFSCNSSTTTGAAQTAITTTSGAGAGSVESYDFVQIPAGLMSGGQVWPMAITRKYVSISSSTTYYLNVLARFSLGTPQWYGSIAARRLR